MKARRAGTRPAPTRSYLTKTIALLILLCYCHGLVHAKTNYKKWLNQEVVWIISKAERKAFRDLKSDGDRETFVAEFWKRRDPTPSTERNEYQEEHYRRLLYAEKAFREGTPGWKTDRGRIYVLHGPPDSTYFYNSRSVISPLREIPATERNPNTLVWVYHQIERATYAKGEMRLIFQPSMGLSRQDFALSDSKTAQERADQMARHFTASDPNWLEADVRFKLVMAGPPSLINAKGADLPTTGQGEFGRYLEDLFRSPGDVLDESAREIARREKVREALRGTSRVEISFGRIEFDLVTQKIFRAPDEWLVPLRLTLPGRDLSDQRLDIYAAVLSPDNEVFDEFIDSLYIDRQIAESFPDGKVGYTNSFLLPSGTYRLRVAVQESSSLNAGLKDQTLELHLGEGPKVDLGGILLTNRVEVLPQAETPMEEALQWYPVGNSVVFNGLRLLENPSQTFLRGGVLFLYLQVQSVQPGAQISLNAKFIQEGQVVRHLDSRVLDVTDERYRDYGTAVPLAGFEPGRYILQVQAVDHTSRTFDIERLPFTILEPLTVVETESR